MAYAVPTPAIPSFTDGTVVHQADLNALASNLTNLYNYGQAGFKSQADCVIARATSTQSVTTNTDTLCAFQTASVNTNSMWVGSQPTQLTIQTAGIYLLIGQVVFPQVNGPSQANFIQAQIMVNGTNPVTNSVGATNLVMEGNTYGSGGTIFPIVSLINLAAGAVVYLNMRIALASGSLSTATVYGGCYLGAIYQTPTA